MRKLTYEFIVSVFEKEGYKVLTKKEDYKNTKTILQIICPDGEYWEVTYNHFHNGQRRPCKPLDYNYVKSYIEKEGYELLDTTYKNNRTKLHIRCPKCNEIFRVHFNNFKDSQSRCPNCHAISKGEKAIESYLKKHNLKYNKEFKFKDCVDKRQLPFDFYLHDYNICIEYNGLQHYTKRFGMSDEDFKDRQKKDLIKQQYCEDNNINLITIPYWDYKNIEKILNEKLNQE